MATAGVQTQFTKASLLEFRKEIEGIGGGIPVLPDELRNVQNNLTRGYVQNFESNDMVAGQIATLLEDGLPMRVLEEYVPELDRQTPDAVMATGRKHYRFEDAVVVIVGDLGAIEKPVRELGWGDVVVLDADGSVRR
jgi:zinc protease